MTVRSHRTAIFMLTFVAFVWGSEFTLIDLAMEIMPVNTFNAIRFTLAGLALIPLFFFSTERIPTQQMPSLMFKGALLGLLLFIAFYTQTEGLRHTSVSNAGFITGLASPLLPVLGLLLFRKKVSRSVCVGVLFATAGLYLLTVGDKLVFNQGDSLVLICAFAFAIHMLLTGRFVSAMPVIPLTIIQLLAVGIYSGISAFLSSEPAFYLAGNTPLSWYDSVFSPIVLSAILIAGILGTAYAYWAQSACQKILPDYKVALIFTLEPIFACATASLFLNETLGIIGLIGAASILLGMLIAETGNKFFFRTN
ncbi:DMT family transporter [Marinomonas foliarum]|uniref:Threonine/homoserine efflux transporter RhtA n=1 Tax=Marinomonas foliarum TaxID=491950 RepID=A0A368ZQN1_9GAMM|nr:DMT family transporter [Marinomonas foliarum]RCW97000.1 threonine/homoserine efflux transporter RhtA [Marinomonas foliarum]